MNIVTEYLNNCKNIFNVDDLSIITYKYLLNHFNDLKITLLDYKPLPENPLSIVKSNHNLDESAWRGRLSALPISNGKSVYVDYEFSYHFSSTEFLTSSACIIVYDKDAPGDVIEIVNMWLSLIELLRHTNQKSVSDISQKYNNLIAQLLHDVQSLIELVKNTENKDAIKKLNYQRRLNKNLLFFVRDFDLFKSRIKIKKFVDDALSEGGLDLTNLNIVYSQPEELINVDVDLMAKAFTEIVKNAIDASGETGAIDIHVQIKKSSCDWVAADWVSFSITNQGNKLSPDFIPFIRDPFFTTAKHDGKTGFGLSNAEKIIKAHNGFIDIIPNENTTQVSINIPQKLHGKV